MATKINSYYYGPLTDGVIMRQEKQFSWSADRIANQGRLYPVRHFSYVVKRAFDKLVANGSIDLYGTLVCRWQHRMLLEDCLARCFENVVVAARKDGYDIAKQVIGAGRRPGQLEWSPRDIHYTLKGKSNV